MRCTMSEIKVANPGKLTEEDWEYLLQIRTDVYLYDVLEGIKIRNRYFVDERFLKLLYDYAFGCRVITNSQEYIEPGRIFYRARVYHGLVVLSGDPKYSKGRFEGYNAEESFVPPPGKATSAGRIDPSYIRYLYTSSDIKTSIFESRATPGDKVSVAEIKVNQLCKMISFAHPAPVYWGEKDAQKEWLAAFAFLLPNLFQSPNRSDEEYFLCQYISEFYKNQGFDGIMFRSAFMPHCLGNEGVNFTFFNYEKCVPISSSVYNVLKMDLTTSPQIEH